MTAGRPTKYTEDYCEAVVAAGEQGLSLTAFAGMIGVARSTINEWIGAHPEFSEAVKIHAAKRTLSLEQGLLSTDVGPRVTARIFALKNAAPDEWRDKTEVEHGMSSDFADLIAARRSKVAELGNGDQA